MPNPYSSKTLFEKAKKKADKLNVNIRLSKTKNKKLDVITKSGKIIPIGDVHYEDFNIHGDKERRKAYRARHAENLKVPGTAGYYANKILW